MSSETARMSAPWLASSLSTALALRSRGTPVQYTVCTTHLSKTLPDKIHIQSTCTKHMHKAHVQNTHAKHTQAQSMWGGRPRGRRKGRTWRRGRAGRSTNRWSGRRRGTCPQPTESAVALDRLCRLRSQDDISCPTGSVLRSVQKLAGLLQLAGLIISLAGRSGRGLRRLGARDPAAVPGVDLRTHKCI